jgi:hypothetical protein
MLESSVTGEEPSRPILALREFQEVIADRREKEKILKIADFIRNTDGDHRIDLPVSIIYKNSVTSN